MFWRHILPSSGMMRMFSTTLEHSELDYRSHNLYFSDLHKPSDRHHLCGFDLNLTYPQTGGTFPTLVTTPGLRITLREARRSRADQSLHHSKRKVALEEIARGFRTKIKRSEHDNRQETKRSQWKRDFAKRANSGALDPWYGCDLFDEMWDYALNMTYPWSAYPIREHSICTY